MKFWLAVALFAAFCGQQAFAEEIFEDAGLVEDQQARFLYFNTSSTATSLTLLGALILLGVIAYLIYAGGLLGSSGYNRNSYDYNQYYDPQQQYAEYRSSDAAPQFNALKILEWIGVFHDMYENYDMNDFECTKKLICEVTQHEEIFGAGTRNLKSGLRAARMIEYFPIFDEARELSDEVQDAYARGEEGVDCAKYFPCPNFSVIDSYLKSANGLN